MTATATDLALPAEYATGEVLTRAATVEEIDVEKGLVDVRLMKYETEAEIDDGLFETFTRSAFKAAVGNPSRVKVTDQGHQRQVVIGQASELRDEEDGLYGVLRIADTTAGRDVLTLLRKGPDGSPAVLDELSVEFRPMKRYFKVTRSERGLHVRHDRATLVGVSPVAAGAYGDGSRVLATREDARDRKRERILAELAALDSGSAQLAGLR